ncbi:MAG: Ni/Fe hydrogenase subunit alpha [Deinococcales bacterium]|jgi:sulfhydrogenase subunit alpha
MSSEGRDLRRISVGALARVEGEGAMRVSVHGGKVEEVALDIYEPPRFFEALLRGRSYTEPPDITARICGICPVAYQTSAVQAIEDACGVEVDPSIRALRRLLYCGEWIQSHALHIYLLHAPDFLGYESALELAKVVPDVVQRGLTLKKAGNDLMEVVGGRSVHPVNVRVGGFYRAPTPAELEALVEPLQRALQAAEETVQWVGSFTFPAFEHDHEYVALRHERDYPMEAGRMVSDRGLDIGPSEFEDHVEELHVEHSNALHAVLRDRGTYMTGPLARYSLNYDRLSPRAQEAARAAGLGETCRNPFQSIVVRAVETLYAVEEALSIIGSYRRPDPSAQEVPPRAGRGCGWSEAPRGLLYHRYTLADDGTIEEAVITPPTSQNQRAVEADLARFVEANLELDDQALTWQCEQAIRNYDPCISCATHFLQLQVERRP